MNTLVCDSFSISFPYDEELDGLTSPRKLAYLANHDGMVFDRDIFCNIARCEFRELVDSMFEETGWAGTLDLKKLLIHRRQIDFVFCLTKDNDKEFRIGVPLDGTSGHFQAYEGNSRYVNVVWEDGAITTASRLIDGVSTMLNIVD